MHRPNDTIAAIATPPGRGGVGIVRVSGPEAPSIAAAILGRVPPPRHADYRVFRDSDGSTIDHGLALYFPAPHSYTGEDVLALHGHGGTMVLDLVMQRVLALGARAARPGEFTERAFLSDKMDLVQAEAVADLIDSASHAAARSALRSLEGAFSERIRALVERLVTLRMYAESGNNKPKKKNKNHNDRHLAATQATHNNDNENLLATSEQGRLLRDGMR